MLLPERRHRVVLLYLITQPWLTILEDMGLCCKQRIWRPGLIQDSTGANIVFDLQAMWLIGPTAMLISAILTIGITAYLDFFFVADKTFIDLLLTLQQHRATTS